MKVAFVLVVEEFKVVVVEVLVVTYGLVLVLVPTFAVAGLLCTLGFAVPDALFAKHFPTMSADDLVNCL